MFFVSVSRLRVGVNSLIIFFFYFFYIFCIIIVSKTKTLFLTSSSCTDKWSFLSDDGCFPVWSSPKHSSLLLTFCVVQLYLLCKAISHYCHIYYVTCGYHLKVSTHYLHGGISRHFISHFGEVVQYGSKQSISCIVIVKKKKDTLHKLGREHLLQDSHSLS